MGLAWLGAAIVAAPWACACRPVGVAGEVLGTYAVTGELVENACAPGFSPPAPLMFRVVLSDERGQLTWRVGDAAPASGLLGTDGRFALRTETQVVAWPPDAARMVVGCVLSQSETVSATFRSALVSDVPVDGQAAVGDAGAPRVPLRPYPGFDGDEVVVFDAVSGSDCAALLVAGGGSFPALPCRARVRLTATRLP